MFSPAWLVFIMEKAERAEPVVLYYLLSLSGWQLSEHFAMPRRVRARAPHHVLEYAHPATISLAVSFPIDPCNVHGCLNQLRGLCCSPLLPALLKSGPSAASCAPGRRLCCRHVQGVSPFLVYEIPESLFYGFSHPRRPLLRPLAPIAGGILARMPGSV